MASALEHSRTPIQIPMRDTHPSNGVQITLAADLYLPDAGSGPWAAFLVQTPYGKGNSYLSFIGERAADPLFNSPHYAFVVMDWRGFGISGSQNMDYPGNPSRGEDGHDAVEWIAAQPWCTGKVGTWGPSALGNVQMKTAAERPPHLACAVPIVYHYREWYDQSYPGGVYSRNRNEFVYGLFGGLSVIRAHPLRDLFWQLGEPASGDPADINIPMLHISGWYDHEATQTIREFQAVQSDGGPGATGRQWLLVGPWSHGKVGARVQNDVEYPAAEFADSIAALAFFDRYLRDMSNGWEAAPPVRFFQTNEDLWRGADAWPPMALSERTLFLATNGTLATSAPTGTAASLAYISQPTNPVPSLCGALLATSEGEQGPGDLRALEARPDVLAFTTPPMAAPLAIAGNPSARIHVRCDAADTDIAIRLTQVFPDGRSIWIQDAIRRVSLRGSFAAKQPVAPGEIYEIILQLPPLAITIPAGHRLRLLVAPSNYDMFDVNPQDGSDFSDASGVNPTPSQVEIFADAAHPSRLMLPIVAASEPDSDADGLPDWWESLYFGSPTTAGPGDDPDGDGADNRAECAAGTRPGDRGSHFALTAIRRASGPGQGFLLEWPSVEDRTYSIRRSFDLLGWHSLTSGLPATPPSNQCEIPDNGSPRAFFLIETGR